MSGMPNAVPLALTVTRRGTAPVFRVPGMCPLPQRERRFVYALSWAAGETQRVPPVRPSVRLPVRHRSGAAPRSHRARVPRRQDDLAGCDADNRFALEPVALKRGGIGNEIGRKMPSSSPISRSRLEFELFRDPTTRTISATLQRLRTADCRFWVACRYGKYAAPLDVGKTRDQRTDDVAGVINAERRLRDIGDGSVIRDVGAVQPARGRRQGVLPAPEPGRLFHQLHRGGPCLR